MSARPSLAPEKSRGLAVACSGEALFDSNCVIGDDAPARLYDKGEQNRWSVDERIDWPEALDPANPLGFDDRLLPLYGSSMWEKLGDAERARVRFEYQTYWVSQMLHSEQAALLAAGRLTTLLPDLSGKRFAAAQAADEARHLTIFERLLRSHLGEMFPMGSGLKSILEQGLGDSRWDMVVLGGHIVVEGMALSAFQQFRDASRSPFMRSVCAFVLEDEARHVAFGLAVLPEVVSGLSGLERGEREEYIIESMAALVSGYSTARAWERSGLPVEECVEWIAGGKAAATLPALFLRRVPPILQRVGLWTDRVATALAKMNVRPAAGVDLDAWMRGDERIAKDLERRSKEKRTAQ